METKKLIKKEEVVEEKATEKIELVKKEEVVSGDYVMKVGHLAWGLNGKNHFYADKKPLINAKVMGKFASILKIWLNKGWIEKGSYK